MNTEEWRAVQETFNEALLLEPVERPDFLDRRCGDASSRKEVDALLAEHGGLGDFMSTHEGTLARGPDTPDPLIEQNLGDYQLKEFIGEGAMGRVYRAWDTKLDRPVAIKLLKDEFKNDDDRRERLQREAIFAGQLSHPNVATIYKFGESGGIYYIAMEYVGGRPLDVLLKESEWLPLRQQGGTAARKGRQRLLDIAVQIALGLTAAHGREIVHRDLKPANLMINDEERVKILDFGLATALLRDAPGTTSSGVASLLGGRSTVFGTVGYSAPEQCNRQPADFRSDLFAFGVILYQLATGVAPFKRDSFEDTIRAVKEESPPPLADVNKDVPAGFSRLVQKLLKKRPDDRYQSSSQVLAELQKMQRTVDQPWWNRWRVAAFVTMALVVAIAILLRPNPVDIEALWRELDMSLPLGRLELANRTVDTICQEDPDGCERAKARLATARGWKDRAADLLSQCHSAIDRKDWATAEEVISQLEELGNDFTPALYQANELRGDLNLEIFADSFGPARISNQAKQGPSAVEETPNVAQDSEETEPQESDAKEEPAQREREGVLHELRNAAKPGLSSQELSRLLQEMVAIDPNSAGIAEVRTWRDERRKQEESYGAGIADFAEASRPRILETIKEYEGIDLRSPKAVLELERLSAGEQWLGRFEEALNYLNDDFPSALDIQEELRRNNLSLDFRTAVGQHLAFLSSEMEKRQGHVEQQASGLVEAIGRLCDDRQLRQAQSKLDELQALVKGFEVDTSEIHRRVEQLSTEEAIWLKLDNDYAEFRRQLKKGTSGLVQLLRTLERDWTDAKSQLSEALAAKENDELLRRRAIINMRLGHFSAVRNDTEPLRLFGEGLLLLSAATFVEAPAERAAAEEALSHVELAIQKGLDSEQSGRASYLQGVYLDALATHEPQSQELLDRARTQLQEAVETHGIESADACYRLSTLHFLAGNNSDAIKFATRAIEAPLTEDDVIVGLGGNRAAVEGAVSELQRDTFLRRAQGRFMVAISASRRGEPLGSGYLDCIADCNKAIALDHQHALSYFLRGFARGEAGKYGPAVQDLEESIKLVGESPDDPELERVRDNAPILRDRYENRSRQNQ